MLYFEEFGLEYFGPVDGHNIPLLVETFKFLKTIEHPVLLHVADAEGPGFSAGARRPEEVPRPRAYNPETGENQAGGPKLTYSEVFANTLVDLAREDERIVAITAAMPNGTGLDLFPPAPPQPLLRCGHCRRTCRTLCRRFGDAGATGRSARSYFLHSSSALSIPSSTTWRCKSCP